MESVDYASIPTSLHLAMTLWKPLLGNYAKQPLHTKPKERAPRTLEQKEAAIFSESFLLKRRLLQTIGSKPRHRRAMIPGADISQEHVRAPHGPP